MTGERLQDFEPGAPGVTVDPMVGTTQPSPDPSAAPQPDPSAPVASAPAAPAGSSKGGGTPPTPASTPPAPAAPAPQPPAGEPPPAAPTVPPEGPPQAAQPPPEGEEEDLTEEQYQQARTRLQEELKGELRGEYDARLEQSRTDSARATDAVKQELVETKARVDQMTAEMREGQIKGLPPEEQERLRTAWANEDKVKEINDYQKEVEEYHAEADVVYLLGLYNQYGVTEEELNKVPIDEREAFCEAKRADYWEQRAQGKGPPATNGQPQQQAPPASQQPVPAGATAPSDTGGGGPVAQPVQPNTDKGLDAMAANIGQGESWERQGFPPPATRRG